MNHTPSAHAGFYLARIARYNPLLHAIVVNNSEDAMRTARQLDDAPVRGPLHGLPVTVKEAFDLAGSPSTVNFRFLRNNIAKKDALLVQRLKAAGAVILGKTNVPTMLADYQTFGPLYPAANNPFDLNRTPGGSTGGGAAAVAAGLTAIEIGSDLGGSIRLPAHFCGVFGLKPTENAAVHGEGHVPPPPGARGGFTAMASLGPLARNMEDIEAAWNVINEPLWSHPFHVPQRPVSRKAMSRYRIAWFDGPHCCGDTQRVLGTFLSTLENQGVKIEKRPFDEHWLREACSVWALLLGAMIGQHAPWWMRQVMKYQLGGSAFDAARAWRAGLGLDFHAFSRALKRREDLVRDLHTRFREYDFIVSPIAAGPAFRHNPKRAAIEVSRGHTVPYLDYAMPYNVPYNVCGNPSLAVPAGQSADGLPVGLQIAAPHYAEPDLIHFGKLLSLTCPTPPGFELNSQFGRTTRDTASPTMYTHR